jgi:type IV pilus assembly protein PilQ
MNYELKIKNLLVCSFVLLAMTTMTVGDDPQATVQTLKVGTADNNTIAGTAGSTVDTATLGTGAAIQSITFKKDAGIRDALRFLAAKYQKNIVPSPKVDGLITVSSLYDVTFEEAMDAILGHGFRYEQEGSFIKVYTEEEYKKIKEDKSRMVEKVFTLYYINAAEVKALITPLLSESGKIGTTTAAAVDTEAGKGGDTTSMRDTVVVYDFPERLDQIGQMIREIDVKPQQIMIEVTVLKVTLTETTEFGIEWTKIAGITAVPGIGFPFGMAVSLPSGITPAGAGLTANFANDEVVAAITALEDVTDVTVLANPKIMALNKQAGYINIGNETGYTESTTQTSGGNTTASVAFLPSGTLLRFRPFICEDGYVRMEVNPEESTATTTTVGSTVIPSKTITQVKTNIMVKDGQTIIIGGLFKEQLTNTDSQVPIIGDLPIVGGLAKRTKDSNIKTELVILMTPHIINEPEQLASESEKKRDDVSRIVHGSRKMISPIARVRIYEDRYANAVRYYSEKKYKKALAELNWIIGFRPNELEAVQLKEKILAETEPQKYDALERIMVDKMRREQDGMWMRR